MWCYIFSSNSIHSLPSWLCSTSLDSTFLSLGYLGETVHHALCLHFPSYPKRNPSENTKNATSTTCGNQAFHNFQSNLIDSCFCVVVSLVISKKSFHSDSKSLPSISLRTDIFFQLFRCQHSSYLWPHKYIVF